MGALKRCEAIFFFGLFILGDDDISSLKQPLRLLTLLFHPSATHCCHKSPILHFLAALKH